MRMTLEDKYKFKELDNRISNGELEAMFEYAWLYHDKFPEHITSAIADKMVEYFKEKNLGAEEVNYVD